MTLARQLYNEGSADSLTSVNGSSTLRSSVIWPCCLNWRALSTLTDVSAIVSCFSTLEVLVCSLCAVTLLESTVVHLISHHGGAVAGAVGERQGVACMPAMVPSEYSVCHLCQLLRCIMHVIHTLTTPMNYGQID